LVLGEFNELLLRPNARLGHRYCEGHFTANIFGGPGEDLLPFRTGEFVHLRHQPEHGNAVG